MSMNGVVVTVPLPVQEEKVRAEQQSRFWCRPRIGGAHFWTTKKMVGDTDKPVLHTDLIQKFCAEHSRFTFFL
jgi:hypothetical protein